MTTPREIAAEEARLATENIAVDQREHISRIERLLAMSEEQIDEKLRAEGIDPDEAINRMDASIERAKIRAASKDGGNG